MENLRKKLAWYYLRIFGKKNMHQMRYFFNGNREQTVKNIEEMRDAGLIMFIKGKHPVTFIAIDNNGHEC